MVLKHTNNNKEKKTILILIQKEEGNIKEWSKRCNFSSVLKEIINYSIGEHEIWRRRDNNTATSMAFSPVAQQVRIEHTALVLGHSDSELVEKFILGLNLKNVFNLKYHVVISFIKF